MAPLPKHSPRRRPPLGRERVLFAGVSRTATSWTVHERAITCLPRGPASWQGPVQLARALVG